MRVIETNAVVAADHTVTIPLPPDIPMGVCKLVVVVESVTSPLTTGKRFTDGLPVFNVQLVEPNCTFRREDLYGDDGR